MHYKSIKQNPLPRFFIFCLQVTGVRQIMIDIESGILPTWSNFSWSENQAYVLQLRGAIEAAGFDVTVRAAV